MRDANRKAVKSTNTTGQTTPKRSASKATLIHVISPINRKNADMGAATIQYRLVQTQMKLLQKSQL